jgi:peptidoglycan/xylan/chitin deacetylase (PgdA/CDA1 family)
LTGSIFLSPAKIPEDKNIHLYWETMDGSARHPLVWSDGNGRRQCAIDFDRWLTVLKNETYRTEHQKPLTAKLPFNYHQLPERIRFGVISAILQIKRNANRRNPRFPVNHFNGGCEILCQQLNSYPDVKPGEPFLILTHDIETEYGFEWIKKISSIEERYGYYSSWNIVPKRYPIQRKILHDLLERGHEIGLHGIRHDNREAFLSRNQLHREFLDLKDLLEEFHISGYRSPAWFRTKRMFEVLSDHFTFDMSCLDTDLTCPAGQGGVGLIRPFRLSSRLLELPCTLLFDSPLYWGVPPERLPFYWQPKIEFIRFHCGMLLITTHPDPTYLGNPKMLNSYNDLLKYLAASDWKCMLPGELSRRWPE